jgi:hypothetical protein
MNKFNTGDKVELLASRAVGMAASAGATAIVEEYAHGFMSIKWERNGLDGGQNDGGYHDGDFKLVPTPKARYAGISDHVLMLCESGHYKPAPEPRVYSSKAQALRVAKEMAKKHGGTFVVFKAVANAVMPTTEPTVTEF